MAWLDLSVDVGGVRVRNSIFIYSWVFQIINFLNNKRVRVVTNWWYFSGNSSFHHTCISPMSPISQVMSRSGKFSIDFHFHFHLKAMLLLCKLMIRYMSAARINTLSCLWQSSPWDTPFPVYAHHDDCCSGAHLKIMSVFGLLNFNMFLSDV